jgi:hypothetical protein
VGRQEASVSRLTFWLRGRIFLLDGNPHMIPWMVPTRDSAPPSFSTHPSMGGNVIGHIRGPGPVSLSERYGRGNDPFRSPFWKGGGLFLAGRSASRIDETPRGSRQSVDLTRDSR